MNILFLKSLLVLLPLLWGCEQEKSETLPYNPKETTLPSVQDHIATLPAPPIGYKWVVNDEFSDEFNEKSLDSNKWHDKSPYWVNGRKPAQFKASAVSVKEGFLQIKNSVLFPTEGKDGTPGTDYNIAAGAVASKSNQAFHGYYEVRMKASKISMSSTFWLNNKWIGGYEEFTYPNYTTEIDIIECVGGAKKYPNKAKMMGSNTHYHRKNSKDAEKSYTQEGADGDVGGMVADEFHNYGMWWKDAHELLFYIDGKYSHAIKMTEKEENKNNLFDRPCFMHLVTETYDWEIPPTSEELNDNNINTTYYDWVRSYKLVKK